MRTMTGPLSIQTGQRIPSARKAPGLLGVEVAEDWDRGEEQEGFLR